jgi:hypothetical protein
MSPGGNPHGGPLPAPDGAQRNRFGLAHEHLGALQGGSSGLMPKRLKSAAS